MKKSILKTCIQMAISKNNPESHPEWGNFHHFSFIVQAGKILSMGFNRQVTDAPLGYKEYNKLHSEWDVYRRAKGIINRTKGFDVVNVRLNKSNGVRLSRPCVCCYNFLQGIDNCGHIYFTTDAGWAKIPAL